MAHKTPLLWLRHLDFLGSAIARLRYAPPNAGLSARVIRAHTGRHIDADLDFYRAQCLASKPTFWIALSSWFQRVAYEIKEAPTLWVKDLPLYRARFDDGSI